MKKENKAVFKRKKYSQYFVRYSMHVNSNFHNGAHSPLRHGLSELFDNFFFHLLNGDGHQSTKTKMNIS